MRKWLILLSALSATAASSAPAWTWVDANGTVHFSDRPVPGARQVELTGAQGFTSSPITRAPVSLPASPIAQPPPQRYQSVEIASPAEQETVWNIGAVLNVQVAVQPGLQPGHRIDLIYDGQRRNLSATSSSLALQDVFRGSHTLQAVVLNAEGAEVTRSPMRTFFVQQTSALNPN